MGARALVAAALVAALPVSAAVDGTTAERKAFAAANPKCRGSSGAALVACPPFQIVYDRPKCLGGVLTWMEISAAKASARSTEFATICATPCTYTYSAWGACTSSRLQTRTVASQSPAPGLCAPTAQILEQSCTYIPPITATVTASPASVPRGGSSTIAWSSTGATSCRASGAVNAAVPTRGSASTGPLTATTTYTLTCIGAGGSATKSVTVVVGSTPPPPPPPTPYEACMAQPWVEVTRCYSWGCSPFKVPRDCYALK